MDTPSNIETIYDNQGNSYDLPEGEDNLAYTAWHLVTNQIKTNKKDLGCKTTLLDESALTHHPIHNLPNCYLVYYTLVPAIHGSIVGGTNINKKEFQYHHLLMTEKPKGEFVFITNDGYQYVADTWAEVVTIHRSFKLAAYQIKHPNQKLLVQHTRAAEGDGIHFQSHARLVGAEDGGACGSLSFSGTKHTPIA